MARVLNGFPTFRLFAALHASFAEAARGRSERLGLASTSSPRDSDYCLGLNRRALPGSVFDARYKGLTTYAAELDAGVCRRARLR
jgi:hypothetical protein